MKLADLFVVRAVPQGRRGAGVFTVPQSLAAFPVATSVVTTLSRAVRTIGRADFESTVVALVAALAVGTAIFVVTVADPETRPRAPSQWLISAAVAASNCLLLYAAALGIEKF